ncbi:MAG TPA: NAD(P)H-dependent oxidoreductase [Methanomassiliicoccales archaeon]|jgi:multimeric flavodoxin WrbA
MNVLILDGSRQSIPALENVKAELRERIEGKDHKLEEIVLRDNNMRRCTGCFGCWVKRPGLCVYEDDSQKVASCIANTQFMVMLTPITFGGYSSLLKNALDRQIQTVLPFFKKTEGEVHHALRYESYPTMLVVGSIDKEDKLHENVFARLAKRNSINGHAPKSNSLVVYDMETREEVSHKLDLVLDGMGVLQ